MCFKPESEVNRRSYIWTCIEKWWGQDGDSDSVWWHDHSLQSVCCSVLQAAVGTGDCCIVCCWAAVAPLSQGSDGLLTNFLAILIHGHGSNNARLLQICTNMHMSWTTVLDRKIRNDKNLCLHFPCMSTICLLSTTTTPIDTLPSISCLTQDNGPLASCNLKCSKHHF